MLADQGYSKQCSKWANHQSGPQQTVVLPRRRALMQQRRLSATPAPPVADIPPCQTPCQTPPIIETQIQPRAALCTATQPALQEPDVKPLHVQLPRRRRRTTCTRSPEAQGIMGIMQQPTLGDRQAAPIGPQWQHSPTGDLPVAVWHRKPVQQSSVIPAHGRRRSRARLVCMRAVSEHERSPSPQPVSYQVPITEPCLDQAASPSPFRDQQQLPVHTWLCIRQQGSSTKAQVFRHSHAMTDKLWRSLPASSRPQLLMTVHNDRFTSSCQHISGQWHNFPLHSCMEDGLPMMEEDIVWPNQVMLLNVAAATTTSSSTNSGSSSSTGPPTLPPPADGTAAQVRSSEPMQQQAAQQPQQQQQQSGFAVRCRYKYRHLEDIVQWLADPTPERLFAHLLNMARQREEGASAEKHYRSLCSTWGKQVVASLGFTRAKVLQVIADPGTYADNHPGMWAGQLQAVPHYRAAIERELGQHRSVQPLVAEVATQEQRQGTLPTVAAAPPSSHYTYPAAPAPAPTPAAMPAATGGGSAQQHHAGSNIVPVNSASPLQLLEKLLPLKGALASSSKQQAKQKQQAQPSQQQQQEEEAVVVLQQQTEAPTAAVSHKRQAKQKQQAQSPPQQQQQEAVLVLQQQTEALTAAVSSKRQAKQKQQAQPPQPPPQQQQQEAVVVLQQQTEAPATAVSTASKPASTRKQRKSRSRAASPLVPSLQLLAPAPA